RPAGVQDHVEYLFELLAAWLIAKEKAVVRLLPVSVAFEPPLFLGKGELGPLRKAVFENGDLGRSAAGKGGSQPIDDIQNVHTGQQLIGTVGEDLRDGLERFTDLFVA